MITNKRIVVVDDNHQQLHLTKLMLEKHGYEVMILQESEKVVETVKAYQPALIFMDHNMPVVDGVMATRLLKSEDCCKHIPIIYYTSEPEIKKLAFLAGADDWLAKPSRLENLVGKVEKLLSSGG